MGAFCANAALADAQKAIDVQTVQRELVAKHATWQAKESWVSRLSEDELKRMMGLQKPPQGRLDFEGARALDGTRGAIDWRNQNGVNWLGPVMNQGNCGSCVAFATVATLEGRTSVAAGAPWLRPTFSPQALFACGGGACESGWWPDEAARYLQTTGIPDEACMPYTSGSTGIDGQCSQKCADADSRSQKINGYNQPSSYGGSVDAVKEALKTGPLVTTLTVYGDFVTYGSGVYKHVTGSYLGGHAVSLVGFDDSKRAWLIRNSWGKEWGENGFAWVSWDDSSGIGADTWAFEIAPPADVLSVVAPLDREMISGTYRLTAQGLGTKTQDVRFRLRGADGRDVAAYNCVNKTKTGCTTDIDTTQLPQGRYEIVAESVSFVAVKSQPRELFVINSEPKATVSFQPAGGTDLSRPLSGRPEFVVTVNSAPVPLSHIEFRAIDSAGRVAAIKSNDYVLPNMKMGWRTMTVPSGRYTILFHGETRYRGQVYAVDSNAFQVTVQN
ncbi:MAG: hypothetical protein HY075_08785 [Deltaproteobacteria bacterium]|nr:hypothetical protein [Deltaproteobacteria bacterium]